MFSFFTKNPTKIIAITLSLCWATSCGTSPSTPYYDSTPYDSGRNPYMGGQSPYGQAAVPPQMPNAYGGSYGGGQNPYAGQNQYGGGYQQPAYGGNYYPQPIPGQAPASRYYSNPYAMPTQQNPYYDQDQYYKPPSHYNSVSDDAADTSFR